MQTVPDYVTVAPDERAAYWQRHPLMRTPLPVAGDVVGYRHDPGGPVTAATVEWIDPMTEFDPDSIDVNVWEYVVDDRTRQLVRTEPDALGRTSPRLRVREDPWPDVHLRTPFGVLVTREARSATAKPGWLPRHMIDDGSDDR